MGFYKIRRSLAVGGGSVQLGADVNLYRSAANVLKTDDALTVVGTLTASGATTLTGLATASAGLDASGGTKMLLPYATATPDINSNGQFQTIQKGNRSYLLYYLGGTPCYITLPQVTAGTMLVTVGGTP